MPRNARVRGEFYRMAVELTSKYWTEKADEAGARAKEMSPGLARDTMLRIAADYDKLAADAAQVEKAEAALRKPR
jgi:hypothetical protein